MKTISTQKNNHKVLAIIPARGGSKGLPGKNIKPLCGKPLINYTIEAALNADLIDTVLVSTDDEAIANVARQAGAEVPFLRPAEYARDNSSIRSTVSFTLEQLSQTGIRPEVYVLLYPTHPFRPPGLIDLLVQKNLSGYSPVLTVKKVSHQNHPALCVDSDGKLRSMALCNPDGSRKRDTYFRDYGLFSGFHLECVYKPDSYQPYIYMVEDPVSLVDIDSMQDFLMAEVVLKNKLFQSTPNMTF